VSRPPREGWLRVVVAHSILVQVATFALRPSLAYAVLDQSSAETVGLLALAFAVPALALSLPAGRVVDRFGERVIGAAGGVLFAAAAGIALIAPDRLPVLFAATFVLGCGHLLSMVAEQTVVANRARPERRDANFGLYTLGASVGQSIGPLLLVVPGPHPGAPDVSLILVVAIVVGLALAGLSMGFARRPPAGVGESLSWGASLRALRTAGTVRALIASSLALASIDVTVLYWPAMGAERSWPVSVVGAMLVARSLFSVLSRAGMGWTIRRVGRRVLVVASLVVAALALSLTALPLPVVALVGLACVFGYAIGICQPVTMSWLAELSPQGARGTMMSVRLAGNRVGQAAVPSLAGGLAGAAGIPGVLVATGLSLGLASWAAAAIAPRTTREPD
jgi:MFS family permease